MLRFFKKYCTLSWQKPITILNRSFCECLNWFLHSVWKRNTADGCTQELLKNYFFTFFQTWKETFCAIILLFHFTRNIWGNDFLIYVIIHQVLWKWQKKSIVLYFQRNHLSYWCVSQHNWQNSGKGDTMADILSPFISKYKYIQPCEKVLLSFPHLILDNNTCTLSSQ